MDVKNKVRVFGKFGSYLGNTFLLGCLAYGILSGPMSKEFMNESLKQKWDEVDDTRPSLKVVGWEEHQQPPKAAQIPDGIVKTSVKKIWSSVGNESD